MDIDIGFPGGRTLERYLYSKGEGRRSFASPENTMDLLNVDKRRSTGCFDHCMRIVLTEKSMLSSSPTAQDKPLRVLTSVTERCRKAGMRWSFADNWMTVRLHHVLPNCIRMSLDRKTSFHVRSAWTTMHLYWTRACAYINLELTGCIL